MTIRRSFRLEHGGTLPPLHAVNPVGQARTDKGAKGLRLTFARGQLHSSLQRSWEEDPLGPLYADVIVPPNTPGIAALVDHSQNVLMVSGDPGREVANRLFNLPLNLEAVPDFSDYDFVAQLRALVWSIAAVILSIGLLAFAVAAVDRAMNRRREVTALQLVGVPRSMLRRTQWIEAAVPLALGSCLAIGLGLLAGATYLNLAGDGGRQPLPWTQSLTLAGIAILGSVLVGGLTVIASSPRISADLIRQE